MPHRSSHLSVKLSRHRRRAATVGLFAAITAVCLGVSACSSSGKSDSPGTGAASAGGAGLTGAPVKVMTYVPLNSKLPTYPNIAAAAQLYQKWVNDNGGINGHPLQVDVCDEKGDPTAAANCARKAVQDKDVAVVGSYGFTGDVTIPILSAAHIAYFGACCPNSAAELTSTDSFNIGNGPMYGPALADRAVKDGHKKINLLIIDGAQTYVTPIQNALKADGMQPGKVVILPAAAQDYSPQVAQVTSDGADAIIAIVSEGPLKAFMPAFQQSGSKAQLYGPQGNLDPAVAKGFESLLNGAVIGGAYPDISLPIWNDFRGAITKYKAPNLDYNTLAGLGEWTAYTAFKSVAAKVTGDLTGASFLAAASSDTKVDTGGMAPTLDFTKPWTDGLPGYTRLFNRTAVFSKLENGKVVPLTSTFTDYSNLALGKPNS